MWWNVDKWWRLNKGGVRDDIGIVGIVGIVGVDVSPYIYPPIRRVTCRHCTERNGSEGSDVTRGSRMLSIKVRNELRCVYAVPRLPRIVFKSVSVPLD